MKKRIKREDIIRILIYWVKRLDSDDKRRALEKRKRHQKKRDKENEIIKLRFRESATQAEEKGNLDDFLLNCSQGEADLMTQRHFERWRELGGGK